jgi:hypothetical protein
MSRGDSFWSRLWSELKAEFSPNTYFTLKSPKVYNRMLRSRWHWRRLLCVMLGVESIVLAGILTYAFWLKTQMDILWFLVAMCFVLSLAVFGMAFWMNAWRFSESVLVRENRFQKGSGQHANIIRFEQVEGCRVVRSEYQGEEFFVLTIVQKKRQSFLYNSKDWEVGIPLDFPVRDLLGFLLSKGLTVGAAPADRLETKQKA